MFRERDRRREPGGVYDEVNPKVMEGDSLPDGCLGIAGPIENGWRVITAVWGIGGSLPAVSGRETASRPLREAGEGDQELAADLLRQIEQSAEPRRFAAAKAGARADGPAVRAEPVTSREKAATPKIRVIAGCRP